MSKWPIKYRAWQRLHIIFNRLAWRYADPGGPAWGKANRINHRHPLWRLNDWTAGHYTAWWATEGRKLR